MKVMKYALAVALGSMMFFAASGARADNIEVDITDVVGSTVYTTGWVECSGTVCSTSGTVGNYTFTSDIAVQLTNGSNPLLDLSYDAFTTTPDAGTLELQVIANGYTNTVGGTQLSGSGNSTLGDTVSFSDYLGNSDTLCTDPSCTAATGTTQLTSLGPDADSSSPGYSDSGSGGGTTTSPYSLGIIADLNNPTGVGAASGDIMIINTPEPSSLWLLGIGLGVLMIGAATRKLGFVV